jgi:toxin CcdB
MAKFDVFRSASTEQLLLECQADLLSHLTTRFVAPLLPSGSGPQAATRLNPVFEIGGASFTLYTQFAAVVPASELRDRICSLDDHAYEISNALDMLINGF